MSDQHAPAADPHVEHAESHPHVNYWAIFFILCALTGVSAAADVFGNKSVIIVVLVLAVACAKALFVMMYFMHLKFEGKWKIVLLAPTCVLALAIPAALMPDIGSHYYDYRVPQLEDDGTESAEHAHSGENHQEAEKPKH